MFFNFKKIFEPKISFHNVKYNPHHNCDNNTLLSSKNHITVLRYVLKRMKQSNEIKIKIETYKACNDMYYSTYFVFKYTHPENHDGELVIKVHNRLIKNIDIEKDSIKEMIKKKRIIDKYLKLIKKRIHEYCNVFNI